MAKKLPRLTPAIASRVRKANYSSERMGTCFICGKGWFDDCQHNWDDIALVVQATKMADVLGISIERSL